MHIKRYISYLRCNVMHFLNETSPALMLCHSCLTMPMLMRLASLWSDNNASSHNASVWGCHMAESQHTQQTLPCVLTVWHRDGNSCQKGPLLLSKQTGMVHRITCFDIFSASATQPRPCYTSDSRWHCNIKAGAGVLTLLCEKKGEYITIMRPVSHTFPLKLVNRLEGMNVGH